MQNGYATFMNAHSNHEKWMDAHLSFQYSNKGMSEPPTFRRQPRKLRAENMTSAPKSCASNTNTPSAVGAQWIFSHSPLCHLFLLALIGFIAYSNTFQVPFVFDDKISIIDNPIIKDLSNFLSNTAGYHYYPRRFIGYLSFALNYRFGGLSVVAYHVVNLAVHITSAILVYFLVLLTFKTPFLKQSRLLPNTHFIALLSALLFVTHPVQTEAVTYIVQRLASLATMFYLLSLVLYLMARLSQEIAGTFIDSRVVALYLLSLLAALAAMKTKETAFTLPFIAAVYEFSLFQSTRGKQLLVLMPLFLSMLVVSLSPSIANRPIGELLSDVNRQTVVSTEISRTDYLLTQFSVITTYLRLLFVPMNQNLDYDYPVSHSLSAPWTFMSLVFLLLLLAVAFYLFRRTQCDHATRLMTFGILWFFITLSVESSIIPINDVIFEHRLYLPSVGVFVAFATGVAFLIPRIVARLVIIAVSLVVVALAITTWKRNQLWREDVTLWKDVVHKSPNKARPLLNLGVAYRRKGLIDEAIKQYRTAIDLKPDSADIHNNLGVAYAEKRWVDRAVEEYLIALRLNPGLADAYNNLGEAYGNSGFREQAMEQFKIAIQLNPNLAPAYFNLGLACRNDGLFGEAIEHYRIALRLDPGYAEAYNNLGVAYLLRGMTSKAIEQFQAAVRLKPANPGFHDNLARAYELDRKEKRGCEY